MSRLVTAGLVVVLLMTALTAGMAGAQSGSGELALEPMTDELYELQGVVPQGWNQVSPGIYVRGSLDSDPTSLVQQALTATADSLISTLWLQLGVTAAPAPVGGHESPSLSWTLYQPGVPDRRLDVAVAEANDRAYLVMLASRPDERDALYAQAFLPALDALQPLGDPLSAAEVLGYTQEYITFSNGDVTLAGTLTMPPGDGPHPAIVLVSGSGPQDRDESLAPISTLRPFRLIADYLTRNGVAVLRYDDRGTAESTGDFATATLDDFAGDAAAALAYLRGRADIDAAQVGLLGHSEGGLVAAMLGASDSPPAFIVTLAGPGVAGRDLLLVQNERLMQADGATTAQIDEQLAFVRASFERIDEQDWAGLETLVRDAVRAQFGRLSDAERQAVSDPEAAIERAAQAQMAALQSPAFISALNYDPAVDWERVQVPVLALFGGRDTQVDATQNAPAVAAALTRGGNPDFTTLIFPTANHLFQQALTGSAGEYGQLQPVFVSDLLPKMTDWILNHVEPDEG